MAKDELNINPNMAPDDIKRQIEALARQNERDFAGKLKLREENGKVSFLGIKMPKMVAPFANVLLNTFIVPISDVGSNFIYNRGVKAAEQLKFSKSQAHEIALAAELVARWGIVFSKPILTFTSASNDYAAARRSLYKEFQPIIESGKINYKTNEVVQSAFDDLHEKWVFNLKTMIPELLTLSIQVPYALQRQSEIRAKRKNQFSLTSDLNKTVDERIEKMSRETNEKMELIGKSDEIIAKKREEYIRKRNIKIDGKNLNSAELGEYFDKNIAPQLKELVKESHKQAADGRPQAEHKSGMFENQYWPLALGGVSTLGEGAKVALAESEAKLRTTNSWEMIKHLKDEMDNRFGNDAGKRRAMDADDIRITTIRKHNDRGHRSEQLSLKEYIVEVFQQLERDRGRAELGPALLEQLAPSVDKIAEYIADGRLDATALVSLVGDNKVIQHRASGAKIFVAADQVQKEIDALMATLGSREKIDFDEFCANFANPALIQKTIRGNLESLQGMEKAVFAAFLPEEILVKTGMKRKEAVALRAEGHAHLYDAVAAGVIMLAKHDPETAKTHLGLSEGDMNTVSQLADKLEAGDWKALETAVDGRDKAALAAVRTGGLNMQARGEKPWAQWIKEGAEIHKKIEEAPPEDKEPPATKQHAAHERDGASHAHRHMRGRKESQPWAEIAAEKARTQQETPYDGLTHR